MSNKSNKIYLFFTTHWDREWYLPFEKFRTYLLNFLDNIFDLIEKFKDYPPFYLDGQVIPVEDYIEIYPEKNEKIAYFCKNRRLFLGPWYTMPDINIINGESLFRNLEIGIKISLSFNNNKFYGFLSDIFGHNSQMPQIFNLFDIDNALLWRGVDYKKSDNEFYWCYPENVDQYFKDNRNFRIKQWCLKTYLYNMEKGYGDAWIKLDKSFEKHDYDNIINTFSKLVKERMSKSILKIPLIQIGVDHCYEDEKFYRFFRSKGLNKKFEIEFELSKYFENFNKCENLKNKKKYGELRESASKNQKNFLIPFIGSSRMDLKLLNFKCENNLIYKAEPLLSFFYLLNHKLKQDNIYKNINENINRNTNKNINKNINKLNFNRYEHLFKNEINGKRLFYKYINLLNYGWKILLKNHAHDSIGGCSIDQVHKDMEYRFDQVFFISDSIISEIKKILNFSLYNRINEKFNIIQIRVFNTLFSDFDDYITFDVRFVKDIEGEIRFKQPFLKGGYYFQYEKVYLFDIYNENFKKIDYDIIEIKKNKKSFQKIENKLPLTYRFDNYKLLIKAKIPKSGYKDFYIMPAKIPSFYTKTKYLITNSIENEFFKITVNSNGTLSIFDKIKDILYSEQLKFRIDIDIGDGYNFYKPVNGSSYYLNLSLNSIEVKNYKNKDLLIINYFFHFPDNIGYEEKSDKSIFKFKVLIDLYKGKKYINFKIIIINNLKNIRFSVYFPVFVALKKEIKEYFAYTPFDIVKRKLKYVDDTQFTEPVPEFDITNGFVFVKTKNIMALFSKGNPEMGVFKNYDNSYIMGITLYRSFSKTVFTDGETDGTLQGKLSFEFSLRLFNEKVSNTEIINDYLKYINDPVYDIKTNYIDYRYFNKNYTDDKYVSNEFYNNKNPDEEFNIFQKKLSTPLIDLKGNFVITSFRMLNENIILLRGFNPEFYSTDVEFKFNFEFKDCYFLHKLYDGREKIFFSNLFLKNGNKSKNNYDYKNIFMKLGEKLEYKDFIKISVFSKEIINVAIIV